MSEAEEDERQVAGGGADRVAAECVARAGGSQQRCVEEQEGGRTERREDERRAGHQREHDMMPIAMTPVDEGEESEDPPSSRVASRAPVSRARRASPNTIAAMSPPIGPGRRGCSLVPARSWHPGAPPLAVLAPIDARLPGGRSVVIRSLCSLMAPGLRPRSPCVALAALSHRRYR